MYCVQHLKQDYCEQPVLRAGSTWDSSQKSLCGTLTYTVWTLLDDMRMCVCGLGRVRSLSVQGRLNVALNQFQHRADCSFLSFFQKAAVSVVVPQPTY